jgi:hypothetical protein
MDTSVHAIADGLGTTMKARPFGGVPRRTSFSWVVFNRPTTVSSKAAGPGDLESSRGDGGWCVTPRDGISRPYRTHRLKGTAEGNRTNHEGISGRFKEKIGRRESEE